ncbi:hypothetical protein BDV95DRAFT_609818 [Massariosphaeria phaeospora]|uniref:Uncharacterized protein n=1 Tax=Massariosphaeria phaeospora TaxID=100035 RepID=A0A7C8I515_9PLEO|nr:hypothetical protein BDV95DRAFT_609818 [Massariosphaeria phaeospora]
MGFLASLPAIALLPSGEDFVKHYTMTLEVNSGLPTGSSGSWVFDLTTSLPVGQIVAEDPFGDIFIVPLCDIFTDIAKVLNAEAVGLPVLPLVRNQDSQSSPPDIDSQKKVQGSLKSFGVATYLASSPATL